MMKLLRIFGSGIGIFRKNRCFERSAAISFYAFFSLIPLMLLITAILGFILGSHAGLTESVIAMARENLPYLTDRITRDIKGVSRSWQTFGWLSIVMLAISAEMVFNVLADALASIFSDGKTYGFFRKKVVNILVVSVAVSASLVSIVATAAAKIFLSVRGDVYGLAIARYFVNSVFLKYALPFILMVVVVTFVYRIFAGGALNLRYAFYGSLFFTTAFEIAKQLFAVYIYNFPTYNQFYGSLAAIMILLMWIFFSSSIFLFSAAIAKSAYSGKGGRKRGR